MFIKTHKLTSEENSPTLAFLPSNLVQTFPCGRRRGQPDKTTFIPFDPEARLNTEANNRKRTGINGFAHSYIKNLELNNTAKKAILSIVLAGYFFQIEVEVEADDDNNISIETFISKFIEDIPVSGADKIFANIKIEKMQLFSEDTEGASEEYKNYKTAVLAPQLDPDPSIPDVPCLDLLVSAQNVEIENSNNYYFSGLSFSTTSITDFIKDSGKTVEYDYTVDVPPVIDAEGNQYVSLCILKKNDDAWQLNQSALLPSIQHGDSEDSVKVAILEADILEAGEVVRDGAGVVTIELDKLDKPANNTDSTNDDTAADTYTLKIFTKRQSAQTN